MVKPLTRRQRLYLRRELHKIRGAVEAARILSEAVATDQLGPDRDHRCAPRAIASVLTLVDERLQRLRRAARRPGASQERPAEEVDG
jgi:regulator of protease activity HflC (stomatin/prohibitin superfamily)